MVYQLSTLVTSVRKRAKDTSFDADLITDYLQETQNSILARSRFPFMERADTDSLAAAATEYDLAEEAETILSLRLMTASATSVQPEYVGYADFYDRFDPETATASSPSHYTVFGQTVVFNAPTDVAYTVKIKYLKTPSVLALDEDVPEIPERYKELLLRGALARVEEFRGNFDIAALHERRVEELSEDMLVRLSLRQLARPHKATFGRR